MTLTISVSVEHTLCDADRYAPCTIPDRPVVIETREAVVVNLPDSLPVTGYSPTAYVILAVGLILIGAACVWAVRQLYGKRK